MTTGTTSTSRTTTRQATARTPDRPTARMMVRQMVMAGCTPAEAANLAALAIGLRPVASGWSIVEIERLRFLRHLAASGRLPA